jgi:hypothetical protein
VVLSESQCKDTTFRIRHSRFLTFTHGFSLIFTSFSEDKPGRMIFFLWLAQIVEDVGYLYRAEFLRPFGVAALHQSIVERLAAVDPSSEMGTCHFGCGIREILKS